MTTPDLSELILDLATEDFVGLWELEWRARAIQRGASTAIERGALMLEVERLLQDGSLALFRGAHFNGDEEQISPVTKARVVVSEAATWEPPATGAVHCRVAATERGERRYLESAREPNP